MPDLFWETRAPPERDGKGERKQRTQSKDKIASKSKTRAAKAGENVQPKAVDWGTGIKVDQNLRSGDKKAKRTSNVCRTQASLHLSASEMKTSLYMVVEHFKNNDPIPVYQRLRDHGRMAPGGLKYLSSWIDDKLECCYQLMETGDRNLLDEWMAHWSDLIGFEVHRVITSSAAAERLKSRL